MTRAVELAQVASDGVSEAFKNRIINGAMVIDQRNAGANVTVSNNGSSFIVDRFRADAPVDQSMTFQQQTSVVPNGFSTSLKVTAGTATSNTSNQPGLFHFVEGYNTADLGFGTANAKTITLSFWVRSSLTGTFGVCFENNDGSRAYIASYTINSANTFEYKTITIAGDTSGTWETTNQRGMTVIFDLGYGTTFSAAASSAWANLSNDRGLTGGVKLAANTGATWYITGVQLEVGSQATSFEYRQYGTELQLCQRYANIFYGGSYGSFMISGSTFALNIAMPVSMRTQPTFSTNISDSNFVVGGPSSSQWAMYIQNSGYNSYSGSINTLSINSAPFNNYNWVQIGTYGCTLNSFTAFLLGSTRFFSFTAEL